MARDRLPRVDENSTLSPAAADFAAAAEPAPLDFWISCVLPAPEVEALVEF
jgi:hypothetical protein